MEMFCMKYQTLFSGKNMKNNIINFSFAGLAQKSGKLKVVLSIRWDGR